MAKITTAVLQKMKQQSDKITMLTAYDASFAKLFAEQGVEVLLIGDSLGMVLQGHGDTLPVTVNDIAYHTRAVRAGAPDAFVIADMPFMSYGTIEQALQSVVPLMQAGANMVKLEGGDFLLPTVKALTERGVPVCGHLGLTPQSVHIFGGYKVQGKTDAAADNMVAQAKALQDANIDPTLAQALTAVASTGHRSVFAGRTTAAPNGLGIRRGLCSPLRRG